MRSIPNEWTLFGEGPWNYSTNAQNIYDFWVNGTERAEPYESLFSLGMRGDGDRESLPLLFLLEFRLSISGVTVLQSRLV